MMSQSPKFLRPIQSFVRREGRLTPGQARALKDLWPRFGLDPTGILDFEAIFGRIAPVTLEIGFGNGESLAAMAAAEPAHDFIGIEVHHPGVGSLLLRIKEQAIANIRVISEDAKIVLEKHVADQSLDCVQLFFPDPWPKKRHHKRRLVQQDFVALVHKKLRLGGIFHMATDWQDYAEHMMAVMMAAPGFENCVGAAAYAGRPESRPQTKFERRGLRLGHGVWDLLFKKTA